MKKITCNAKVEENEIIISNLKDDEIKIDISGDIDFTNIVSVLSEFIDGSPEIDLIIKDERTVEDEKFKLIIETLKDIFENYNTSIRETVESEDDDNVPF